MNYEKIKQHWETIKQKDYIDHSKGTPTSRDPYQRMIEEQTILKFIKINDSLLDMGCGDGYSTNVYSKRAKRTLGIDYSLPLIRLAKERYAGNYKLIFDRSDIFDFDTDLVDVIISQRFLINFPSWELQQKAINKMLSLLKPLGRLILAEGFTTELNNLNVLRTKFSLEPINVVDYNLFLDKKQFERFMHRSSLRRVFRQSLGMYHFLSRLVHPLTVYPHPPKHEGPFNEIAMKTHLINPSKLQEYGYETIYVFIKR